MNHTPKLLGFLGERYAAQYLKSKGYEIIGANFTIRGGEIDLIARHNGLLVFVEIKTRTGKSFGTGDESFNHMKKRRIVRAVERYVQTIPPHGRIEDPDYRIDLIEVELDPATNALKNIYHHEDVDL